MLSIDVCELILRKRLKEGKGELLFISKNCPVLFKLVSIVDNKEKSKVHTIIYCIDELYLYFMRHTCVRQFHDEKL